MGSRGPAPHPAGLKILKGNGVDRDADGHKVRRQPTAVPGLPPMPDGLNEDGERAWNLAAPRLFRMGILGLEDEMVLEAYCRTYQLWRAHDGGRGDSTLTANLIAVGSKLGLDPMSRMRMTLPEKVDDEESDVFRTG